MMVHNALLSSRWSISAVVDVPVAVDLLTVALSVSHLASWSS